MPSIMGAVAKHIFLVTDPAKLEATVRTAFEIARTGRPGPVVDRHAEGRAELGRPLPAARALLPIPGYRRRMRELTEAALETPPPARFFEMLGEARRPLIYAGGGVINGERRALRSPSSRAPSAFPWSRRSWASARSTPRSRWRMRMLGMHGAAFANYAVDDCDFLIAVGARFDDRVAGVPAEVRAQRASASRTWTSTARKWTR